MVYKTINEESIVNELLKIENEQKIINELWLFKSEDCIECTYLVVNSDELWDIFGTFSSRIFMWGIVEKCNNDKGWITKYLINNKI